MKSKLILAVIIGMSSVLQAQSSSLQKPEANPSGHTEQPTPESIGLTIFADALFWQAQQLGTYAFGTTTGTSSGGKEKFLVFSFPWNWGLRTGIRYDTSYDHWNTQLYYTWFRTHATSGTNNAEPFLIGNYNANGLNAYSKGNLRWSLLFNMFDWELGRDCLVSKTVLFRPFLGLKGGWIYQNINAHFRSPGLRASEHVKNDFYGVGPKGGLDGKWKLGRLNAHVFSLIGDFAGAFLWGRWTIKDVFRSSARAPLKTIFPSKTYGAFMIEALMGLEWDFHFNKGRSQFSVRAGYEVQFWVNQLQIETASSGTTHHDLTLQGGTFEVGCKF